MPRGFLCGIDEGAPVSRFHAEKTRERAVMPACERALCPDQVERAYFAESPHPTRASFGVETAEAGMPDARSRATKSSVCARERKTARYVCITTFLLCKNKNPARAINRTRAAYNIPI